MKKQAGISLLSGKTGRGQNPCALRRIVLTEVVSVKFKNKGKVYFFSPNSLNVCKGDHVVVETAKGLEYAECVGGNHLVEDSAVRPPLRPVVRLSTEEDNQRDRENRDKEAEAFEICRQKIEKHSLDMKLVDVEYNFEGNKVLFFFTSEGRVDFRDLVKDLAAIFKIRIELRQIGVRDEARMLGGLGICGKPFCCAQFLDDFQPVSIKMAKTQGLSLNPTKISGTCGRLMCCLKYEQDAYEDLVKNVPKMDAFVETPAGKGSVMDVNLLKGTVRVRLEDQNEMTIRTFKADEVEVLGGKAKRAEYLALRAEGKVEAPRLSPRFKKPAATISVREEKQTEVIEERHSADKSKKHRQKPQKPRGEKPEEQKRARPEEKLKTYRQDRLEKVEKQERSEKTEKQKRNENVSSQEGQNAKKSNNRRRRYHRGKKPGGSQNGEGGSNNVD